MNELILIVDDEPKIVLWMSTTTIQGVSMPIWWPPCRPSIRRLVVCQEAAWNVLGELTGTPGAPAG